MKIKKNFFVIILLLMFFFFLIGNKVINLRSVCDWILIKRNYYILKISLRCEYFGFIFVSLNEYIKWMNILKDFCL